jgi:4-amino-4-deoxy-L-arabinose transferase-like glycosyltransferase
MNIKSIIRKPLLLLVSVYFISRLVNLLKLPIFNDEAIYLDWGFKEINSKGLAFYSLFDGKPPFLMWIFGIFQKFISDPLLAGRIVSVIAGFLTLIGIYKLSKKYFDGKVALLAGIFYITIPLFTFFDRQALMESAVAAIGVWSLYYFLELDNRPEIKNAIILGVIWGIGIFIKQSVLVFIIAEIAIGVWFCINNKNRKFGMNLMLTFLVSQIVLCPLYFQKNFWVNISSGSRFAMSIKEILSFPIGTWLQNLKGMVVIPLIYFFIPIFLLTIAGIIQTRKQEQKIISVYFLISLLIVFVFSIIVTPRYIVAYLPLAVIFAAHAAKSLKNVFVFISVLMPVGLTTLLIFSPLAYFELLNRVGVYSQNEEYVTNWTSGYAVTQAVEFIKSVSKNNPVVAGVRLDAGNPESAIFAYFNDSKKVVPIYFDSKIIDKQVLAFDCIDTNIPFYFIARDETLAGMGKFLIKVAEFKNPVGERFVGVYTLKNDCKVNTLKINF